MLALFCYLYEGVLLWSCDPKPPVSHLADISLRHFIGSLACITNHPLSSDSYINKSTAKHFTNETFVYLLVRICLYPRVHENTSKSNLNPSGFFYFRLHTRTSWYILVSATKGVSVPIYQVWTQARLQCRKTFHLK